MRRTLPPHDAPLQRPAAPRECRPYMLIEQSTLHQRRSLQRLEISHEPTIAATSFCGHLRLPPLGPQRLHVSPHEFCHFAVGVELQALSPQVTTQFLGRQFLLTRGEQSPHLPWQTFAAFAAFVREVATVGPRCLKDVVHCLTIYFEPLNPPLCLTRRLPKGRRQTAQSESLD